MKRPSILRDHRTRGIYQDPVFYDLQYDDWQDDLGFYREQASLWGRPILELGCGTGRVTSALLAAGLPVTALDRSWPMVRAARHRLTAYQSQVRLLVGDCRRFRLRRRFSFIFLAFGVISHLPTGADLLACLSCAREHLHPEGAIVFDVLHPSVQLEAYPLPSVRLVGDMEWDRGGDRLLVTEERTFQERSQLLVVRWRHRRIGDGRGWVRELRQRVWWPQELVELVGAAGLSLPARYGDYDGRRFDRGSPVQIYVCRLPSARTRTWPAAGKSAMGTRGGRGGR